MRTNVKSYYDLLTFGLGNYTFQQFVDKFKTKYNQPQTDGFVWDNEIQLDFTYEQLEAELGIATLPTYVDVDSPGVYKSFDQYKIGSNKIPRQKHGFAMNEKILREKMIMVQRYGQAALNADTQNALMNLQFDSVDKLLAGDQNAITHQRMRTVSTGQFSITAENNPNGLKGLTFDFGIPAENKVALTTTARWWTTSTHITANEGTASDPLQFLKDKRKQMKKAGFPDGHYEMSEDMFDDLLTHSKVLKRIGLALNPNLSTDDQAINNARNRTDDELKAIIQRIIGCPIVTRDSRAAVDKFDSATKTLKKETIENFDPKNVAFVPNGQIGTIKAVQPLFFDDPAVRTALFNGGRTLLTQRYDSATKSMYVESEMTVLCVPQAPRYMCVFTVTE